MRWFVRHGRVCSSQRPPAAMEQQSALSPPDSPSAAVGVSMANASLVSRNTRQHGAPCSSTVLILPDVHSRLSRKEEEKPYVFLHVQARKNYRFLLI